MLITTTCQKTCGFTPDILAEKVIPGATFIYFLGNSIFGWWGQHQSRKTGRAATTALPHGINVVIFFAFTLNIMGPVYNETKSAEAAWCVLPLTRALLCGY